MMARSPNVRLFTPNQRAILEEFSFRFLQGFDGCTGFLHETFG